MIIDKTNAEGYNDPTAYEAVKNLDPGIEPESPALAG